MPHWSGRGQLYFTSLYFVISLNWLHSLPFPVFDPYFITTTPFGRVCLVLGADCQRETFKLTHPVVLVTHVIIVTNVSLQYHVVQFHRTVILTITGRCQL